MNLPSRTVLPNSAILMAWFIGTTSIPSKADQLWLQPVRTASAAKTWYPPSIQRISGMVSQFDDKRVVLVDQSNQNETQYSASRVLWIESAELSANEKKIREAFLQQDDTQVLSMLPSVLNERPAVWRQQWLTMLASVSAWRTNRGEIALTIISQLDARPLPPLVVAWLPISWMQTTSSPLLTQAAVDWMFDESELVRLTACSWLLSTSKRNEAITVLKQLVKSNRSEVVSLATALLWKIATPNQVLEQSNDWQATVKGYPMVLQTGPLALINKKLQAANQLGAANRIKWSLELTPRSPNLHWIYSTDNHSQ